jgi:LacI family transcriptional regulator
MGELRVIPTVRAQDVAFAAGVSLATVSRTFNNPDLVRPMIRQQVLDAAQRLGWMPNGAARALAMNRTYTVGAILPTIGHLNFARQIEALLLGCSNYDPQQGLRHVESMLVRGVDGLVLLGEDYPPETFALLKTREIPYVVTYTFQDNGKHPYIGFSHYAAYQTITNYLLELGHRSFGLILQKTTNNSRVQERKRAVIETLASKGLLVHPRHYAEGPLGLEYGRIALRSVLSQSPKPTAIICGNDHLAIGALLEAKQLGISVPGQLSITGFDDIELAANCEPSLTTMRAPDYEIGRLAGKYLVSKLAGQKVEQPASMTTDFVIRESTEKRRG